MRFFFRVEGYGMKKQLITVTLAFCVLFGGSLVAGEKVLNDINGDGKVTIGLSVKTVSDERWSKEVAFVQKFAEEMGAEVLLQVAENDGQLQLMQIENLLTQGIDVLIFNTIDESAITGILDEVHEEGIPILSYEYAANSLYADAYVGPDPVSVGRQITKELKNQNITGKYVLIAADLRDGTTPKLFLQGMMETLEGMDIDWVMKQHCENWDPSIAQGYAENALTQHGGDIAAFAVMNDGMAAGVISALEVAGLAGKIPVTGMDGDMTAVQRVAAGTQLSTVLKPSESLAKTVVELAYRLATQQEIPHTDKFYDFGKTLCPHYETGTVLVTRDNIDKEIIETHIFTRDQVYNPKR